MRICPKRWIRNNKHQTLHRSHPNFSVFHFSNDDCPHHAWNHLLDGFRLEPTTSDRTIPLWPIRPMTSHDMNIIVQENKVPNNSPVTRTSELAFRICVVGGASSVGRRRKVFRIRTYHHVAAFSMVDIAMVSKDIARLHS